MAASSSPGLTSSNGRAIGNRALTASPLVLKAILWGYLVVVLAGAVLIPFSPAPPIQQITPGTGPATAPSIDVIQHARNTAWMVLPVCLLGVVAGLLIALSPKASTPQRIGGGILAVASLFSGSKLIGTLFELKPDVSVNVLPPGRAGVEKAPDRPAFTLGIEAEQIGTVGPFATGQVKLSEADAADQLSAIETMFKPDRENTVLIVLIGTRGPAASAGGSPAAL